MLFKLAISNVKKSFNDYMIYFLTLSFAICLFYIFNSIDSQKAMMIVMSESKRQSMQVLSGILSYVSIFISVILAFLILYANRFLIKRRKKELGIYMILGMKKSKMSFILVIETLIVGIISLICGLVVGVFLSQFLSILTAKLFMVKLSQLKFLFSIKAFNKTLLYFGLIFLIVMIFNIIIISKTKLINLLYAKSKNEKFKIKKIYFSVFLFILSIVFLGSSYMLIIHNGMLSIDFEFASALVCGTIGTLLFFMSLSGFLLKIIKLNKKLYFKELNMFVLRQFNSQINTTFISMTIICIMLLIAIGTLSTGFGTSRVINDNMKRLTPYDATVKLYNKLNENDFKDLKNNLNKISNNYQFMKIYSSNLKYKDILKYNKKEKINMLNGIEVGIISKTQFNNMMKINNDKNVSLKDNEYIILSDMHMFKSNFEQLKKNRDSIVINNNVLNLANDGIRMDTIESGMFTGNMLMVIVSDEIVKKLDYSTVVLNIKYKNKLNELDEKLEKVIKQFVDDNGYKSHFIITKNEIIDQSIGLTVITSYVGIYVGTIFILASVVILALQQLSQANDNVERYQLLRKLGADDLMLNKTLFKQILIYFIMPLSLAIIHSIVGISVANNVVQLFGKMNIVKNSIMIAIIFILIYGIYFLVTYYGSKSIIRKRRTYIY